MALAQKDAFPDNVTLARHWMKDLSAEIEATLLTHRLPSLNNGRLDGEFVLPHYDGLSIVNLPATTAALLGVPFSGAPPLPPEIWKPFAGGVRCVVRVVIDALGYDRLRRHMAAEHDTVFHRLLRQGGQLVPLTSVCPSTTVTALSSLWSGRTPAEHGMMGTRLFLRNMGVQAHMIFFNPVGFERRNVLLEEGLKADQFLPVPGFAEHLTRAGIESHVFINQRYENGGLSDIFFRGAKAIHPFVSGSGADLWINLRRFMEKRAGDRLFISVYWGVIDALAHERGPSFPGVDAELRSWTTLMTQEFLDPLSPAAADGTVFLILSDHGQLDTPSAKAVHLDQHPALLEHLMMKPAGEPRLPFIFIRQGQLDAARDYVRRHLAHAFLALDSQQALQAGLFGPGDPAPETSARLGDLILACRGDTHLHDQDQPPHLLGLHGGLSREEMWVPLLLKRLDT